jgi:AcrR family transcriptional regulator
MCSVMARQARGDGPTKGERTKQRIVETAAELFNTRGYQGTAVTDVAEAADLEKGAVYNYFPTKDALAMAAFAHNADALLDAIGKRVDAVDGPVEQLLAMLEPYRAGTMRPAAVKGGCPLLNTAVESTDTHPALRQRARSAFATWGDRVEEIVARGIAGGVFRRELRPATVAAMFIASLEGGIMLARLYRDGQRLCDVVEQIEQYVRSLQAEH